MPRRGRNRTMVFSIGICSAIFDHFLLANLYGTTGRITCEGCAESCRMVWRATCMFESAPHSLAVFRLRSQRGKLELVTSSLIACPTVKTLLVDHSSMVYS